MKFKTYKYYESDENGVVEEKYPTIVTLKEGVDVSKLEKELNTKLILINEFDYVVCESEFYKFIHNLTKNRFSNSLPTFVSVNWD